MFVFQSFVSYVIVKVPSTKLRPEELLPVFEPKLNKQSSDERTQKPEANDPIKVNKQVTPKTI